MTTSPLLSNVRHSAITPVRPLLTRLIHISRVIGQFIVRLKLFSKWKRIMKITANGNDTNDILHKLNCSNQAAGSYWSLRRKALWKMKNAKGCFGG